MDVFYDPGPSRAVVKHLLAFIVMNRFCVALSCGRPKMAVSGMGTYMCCGGDARAARGARARARSAAAAAVMRARGGAKTCTILAPAGAEKMISRRWRGPTWVGEVCVLAHGGGGGCSGMPSPSKHNNGLRIRFMRRLSRRAATFNQGSCQPRSLRRPQWKSDAHIGFVHVAILDIDVPNMLPNMLQRG
jgi:hypothetical protein